MLWDSEILLYLPPVLLRGLLANPRLRERDSTYYLDPEASLPSTSLERSPLLSKAILLYTHLCKDSLGHVLSPGK